MSLVIVQQPSTGGSGAASTQAGQAAVSNGANSVAITFSSSFASTPTVRAVIAIPTGGAIINAVVDNGTVTTTGFTAILSAVTPNGNYKLNWEASA